jgi:probable rRNA maturation factor
MPFIEEKNLTIIRKRGNLPPLPYKKIKETILGKSYELTLIFCTEEESQERNNTYRQKDHPTNILSFPLDEKEGEIYICPPVAKKDAKKFEMTELQFLHLLLVHGCLHLKGHDHGSTMEELEAKYVKKFYRGE